MQSMRLFATDKFVGNLPLDIAVNVGFIAEREAISIPSLDSVWKTIARYKFEVEYSPDDITVRSLDGVSSVQLNDGRQFLPKQSDCDCEKLLLDAIHNKGMRIENAVEHLKNEIDKAADCLQVKKKMRTIAAGADTGDQSDIFVN